MKLINLRLKDEPLAICIEAEGQVWDLHNAFDFDGVRQNICQRSVRLSWQSSRVSLPASFPAFEIMFSGVGYFEVTPRDSGIPYFAEDLCLAGVSRVLPEDDSRDLIANGVSLTPDFPDERFHLWFAFRGGQHIRVGAETAVFRVKHINEAD